MMRFARRADDLWVLGYTLLFLVPSLILFTVGLVLAGSAWLALWLVYVLFMVRNFRLLLTRPPS